MTELTLTVPQGIGDTYWVYQVFAKHVDALHFRIATTPTCPKWLENRADRFLLNLPKVRSVQRESLSCEGYVEMMYRRFDGDEVVRNGGGAFGCNAALEAGERIESLWPGHGVYWNPPIKTARPEQKLPVEYLLLFVGEGAGMPDNPDCKGVWSPEAWAEFTYLMLRRGPQSLPVVVIGAEYDRYAGERTIVDLQGRGVEVLNLIGLPIEQSSWLIKRARLFLCYQSGLKCIADRFNVPQAVLWFPKMTGLRYSFPKVSNIKSGRYQAFLFTQSPQEVAQEYRWN